MKDLLEEADAAVGWPYTCIERSCTQPASIWLRLVSSTSRTSRYYCGRHTSKARSLSETGTWEITEDLGARRYYIHQCGLCETPAIYRVWDWRDAAHRGGRPMPSAHCHYFCEHHEAEALETCDASERTLAASNQDVEPDEEEVGGRILMADVFAELESLAKQTYAKVRTMQGWLLEHCDIENEDLTDELRQVVRDVRRRHLRRSP